MLVETEPFHQGFESATRHLEALRRQLDLLPDCQAAPHPALEKLAEALAVMKQAYCDLSQQSEAGAARSRDVETECAYYRGVFEHAPHAWLLTDLNGTIQAANAPASTLLRTPEDSLAGRQLADFLPGQASEAFHRCLAQLKKGDVPKGWEFQLQATGDDVVTISVDAVPVHGPGHQIIGLQWLLRDISREAQAEEERERLLFQVTRDRQHAEEMAVASRRERDTLQAVMESTPAQVAYLDPFFNFVLVNTAYAEGSRHAREELIGRNHFDLFPNAENEDVFKRVRDIGQAVEYQAKPFEFADQPERGVTYWDWTLTPVKSNTGQVEGLVLSLVDVTRQVRNEKDTERLLTENRTQREFLERLVETAPVGIAVLRGPEHRYELANPYYRAMTGAPDRPIVGRTIVEAIPDLAARGMPALMDQVYRTGQTVSTREIQLSVGPGREETYWNTDRVPLRGVGGAVESILVLAHDVTREVLDRRRIEALSARAERQAAELEAVFASLIDPVLVYDPTAAIVRANPAAVESLGLDPAGLPMTVVGQNVSARYPDGRTIPADDLVAARALRGETVRDEPELILRARGGERAIVTSAAPIVSGGRISGAVAVWHDVTNLRRAESTLRQLNERLELTQAAAGVGSWDWDIPADRIEWTPKMFELFGLDMRVTSASFDAWRSVLHPEDREETERQIDQALKDRSELANEYRIIRSDGQIRWISALGKGVYDAQGRPVRMSGICLDITERKREEEKVEHLSSFPRLNPNPVLEMDASGAITYANSAATAALARVGAGDDCHAFFPRDMATILRTLQKKKETRCQREVQVGSAVFSETIQVIPAFRVARIYAFDITERKRAEEALRSAKLQVETEKRHLEAVLQALPVGVVITDARGGVLLTNGMDEQVWGPRPATHDVSDYAQYKAWWADSGQPVEPHDWASAQAVQKGEPVFGQMLEIQRFDGRRGFVLNSAVPIRDEEGRIIGSAVAIQDVTDLRCAEEALRASEQKYRLLFQNMAEGFALYELLYDPEGRPADWRVLEINDAYTRHTGIARDQIADRRMSELFPEAIPEYLPRFAAVVATQTSSVSETYARAVGRHQRVFTFPAGDHRFASTIEDISERKRAEEALRASEEKFAAVFRFSPAGLIIAKADDGTFLEVNEAFATALGCSRSENTAASNKDVSSLPSTDARNSLGELIRKQEPVVDHELDLRTKDGGIATMLVSLAPIEVGEAACMLAVVHDITKRKQSEEELRHAQAELAQVAEERARTEERQRLARELHDSISQALYGVSLGVNTALTLLETDRTRVLEALKYTLSQAHAGLTEMRALIFELRPESLEVEGLVAALTKQTAALSASRGVEVALDLCAEPDVPVSVKEALYRIAQQALDNAAKHAKADRLEVRLSYGPDGLQLEVSDNGVGFDPQALYPGHLGLQSMRERAMSVGGSLQIVSSHDRGTKIRAHVPIPPAKAA